MKLYRNLILSKNALLTHKLRTSLALLGFTIGVAVVIIMVSIGNGARQEVLGKIRQMGTNLLNVQAGKVKRVTGRNRQAANRVNLKMRDWQAVDSQCPAVQLSAPGQEFPLSVKYGNLATRTAVLGSTPEIRKIRNFPLAVGRFFTHKENKLARRVTVLGSKVRETLFAGRDPVGEFVRISNIPFEVIGVVKPKGSSPDGTDDDDRVVIPINTAMRRVFNVDYIKNIYIQVKDVKDMQRAETEVREILRERHRLNRKAKGEAKSEARGDDFTILNQMYVMQAQKETAQSFTLLIAGTAAISLFVGGIGILGVMLLSVRERTNEIGLRMAAGARTQDILAQFLFEAILLGFAGCAAGVMLGVTGSWLIGVVANWQIVISPASVVAALLFSLPAGILFGLYPARKASLLNPIDALRAE